MSTLSPPTGLSRREFVTWMTAAGLGTGMLSGCQASVSDVPAAQTRTVEGYFGPVEVPMAPDRLVAAESITLGHLLALGVSPVAAAVNQNSLPTYQADKMTGVLDVTEGDGMNLEKALSTDPDLIVTVVGDKTDGAWNQKFYDQYSAAMTTFGYLTGYTYIEEIQGGLDAVARAIGRDANAAELAGAYQARVAELGQRVKKAGLGKRPVSTVRLSQGYYSVRVGTSESIAFRALGMTQPPDQRDPAAFSIELSLERLDVLNEADTLFVYADDNAAADRSKVEATPLWKTLEPVRNGRVVWVNSGIWNSIDIIGLMHILDDIETHFIVPDGG